VKPADTDAIAVIKGEILPGLSELSFEAGNVEVDPKNQVILYRLFHIKTPLDARIESLPLAHLSWWRRRIISAIRYYQRHWSRKLGNRCVYDPSCSHYAELAFRKYGFWKAVRETSKRLKRCNHHNGGFDLPAELMEIIETTNPKNL